MMRNWMKWPFVVAIFVFGVALGTAGVGQSWVSGDQKKIAYRTTPKWEIPFHRDAFKGDGRHSYALELFCSSPENSASWVCKQLERQKREKESLKSEILSLKKQLKQIQSVVSVLDADLKHRLEEQRRREERRKARREARLERKRKRKEQERKRREFEAEQERFRRGPCPRTKHGLFTPSSCIIP